MSEHREDDDRGVEGGEPSFRVIDRRRFAPDGSERTPEADAEAAAQEQASRTAPEAPSRPSAPPPPMAPPGISSSASPSGTSRLAEPQGAPYDPEEAASEASFATLVLSLSTQALMCLGEIPEGPGAEPQMDLAAARNIIDLLGVLERKTRGNLTEDENALLERILYDLRIRFVQLSGSGG